MKACRRCDAQYEPSPAQIKRHNWICSPCQAMENKEQRARRKAAGLPISGSKTWHPAKRIAWWERRKLNPDHILKNRAIQRRYALDPAFRPKLLARRRLRTAIENGSVVRGHCSQCGSLAQAHHDDYSKPLEVRWLCPRHHAEYHAKAKGQP